MTNPLPHIDAQWTLLLDRDGVINEDNIHGYILDWESFHFNPGVLEALQLLAGMFPRILIITNQRGVGRGLMTQSALDRIHENMIKAIREHGGRIDQIYFCTSSDVSHPDRKPKTGMALQAKADFPQIDFSKAIMVGNTRGDMEFGRNIGAYTIYIHNREDKIPDPETIDARYENLHAFAKALASR